MGNTSGAADLPVKQIHLSLFFPVMQRGNFAVLQLVPEGFRRFAQRKLLHGTHIIAAPVYNEWDFQLEFVSYAGIVQRMRRRFATHLRVNLGTAGLN